MNNLQNFPCDHCGKWYVTNVSEYGDRSSLKCNKCTEKVYDADAKFVAGAAVVIFGLLAAGLWAIYAKSKNKSLKEIAIGVSVILLSIFIIIQGGFIGVCIVAGGLFFGWKYLKKLQLSDKPKDDSSDVVVENELPK